MERKLIGLGLGLVLCWAVVLGFTSEVCAGVDMPTGLLDKLPDETMSDAHMRIKMVPLKKVKSHAFSRSQTVPDWRQAMPIGNGDFGAAVHGYPDNLTFHIGKTDIWWDNKDSGRAFPPFDFAECRKRLEAGDTKSVNDALRGQYNTMKSRPVETAAARFTLQLLRSEIFYRVSEHLDLSTATAQTRFCFSQYKNSPCSVDSFVSQPAEVMVVRVNGVPGLPLNTIRYELSRDPMETFGGEKSATDKYGVTSSEEMDAKYQPRPVVEDGIVWFQMMVNSVDEYGHDEYVVMLGCDSKEMTAGVMGPEIFSRFRTKSDKVTFYITVVSTNDIRGPWTDPRIKGEDMVAVAKKRIQKAIARGYDSIRQEHVQWWQDYWKRSWVSMQEKQGEYPWYWTLYKAGSARRVGKVAPGWCAPWRKGSYMYWGFYRLNYEIIHYNEGALTTNHAELLEPIMSVMYNMRDIIRTRTKEFYNMDGLCYPHAMSYRGHVQHYNNTCMNVETAGEAVRWHWEYYKFTGDKEFLREVAYPLLSGVADFYVDYLQEDENGQLYIFPSYYSEWARFLLNSVTDVSMFNSILRNAAEAADALGVDSKKAEKWRDARKRLAPLPVDEGGAWTASAGHNLTADEIKRHAIHVQVYPIAMADLVNKWHGSEELRQQAQTTYHRYLGDHPDAWDKSTSYMAGARMGDREYYRKMLGHVLTERIEYGNIKGGGEWNEISNVAFHIDAGAPFPAGVLTEFLLNSQFGEIRLFPAMPLDGHYAFHSLRTRGAFLVSSEMRDGKVPYALIKSLRGNTCNVVQPFGQGVDVQVRDLASGKIVKQVNGAEADQVVSFETTAKHTYVIERKDVPLEKVPVIAL